MPGHRFSEGGSGASGEVGLEGESTPLGQLRVFDQKGITAEGHAGESHMDQGGQKLGLTGEASVDEEAIALSGTWRCAKLVRALIRIET